MDKYNCLKIEEKCLSCGKCVKNCVMLQEYAKDPKQFFSLFNKEKTVDIIVPYSCSVCGYCNTICPQHLNLGDGFMEIRNALVLKNNGKVPLSSLSSVNVHQKLSFSGFFTI